MPSRFGPTALHEETFYLRLGENAPRHESRESCFLIFRRRQLCTLTMGGRYNHGAERGIRTPEDVVHRFSRPAPWARLSYLRLRTPMYSSYLILGFPWTGLTWNPSYGGLQPSVTVQKDINRPTSITVACRTSKRIASARTRIARGTENAANAWSSTSRAVTSPPHVSVSSGPSIPDRIQQMPPNRRPIPIFIEPVQPVFQGTPPATSA